MMLEGKNSSNSPKIESFIVHGAFPADLRFIYKFHKNICERFIGYSPVYFPRGTYVFPVWRAGVKQRVDIGSGDFTIAGGQWFRGPAKAA